MHGRLTLFTTLALAAVALSGCVGEAAPNGTLYVKDDLTDEVAEVHVTFTEAEVQDAEGAWMSVFDGTKTIELLSLNASDAKAELASFDIAPGEYQGLRVAISEVRVVDHEGNESLLNVFGNLVEVSEDFTVAADGSIDILVDFDLERGVDLEAGTYTPVVADVQTSDDDHDGDGIDDVEDTDDDGDGREDADDDDRDGDGRDDDPSQRLGNYHGICNAWDHASEQGKQNGRAFQKLEAAAERHGMSVEDFCERAEERKDDRDDDCDDLREARREAREDRDEAWRDANETRDERLADGDNETEVRAAYEAEVAEIQRDYREELRDIDEDARGCRGEKDDCMAEVMEELREARQERNESWAEANETRDQRLAAGENATLVWADHNETVAEIQRDYRDEVREAHEEGRECRDERHDDDHDEDDD